MKVIGAFASAVASAVVPVLAAAGGALLLGACASCQSTARDTSMPVLAAGSFDGVEADQKAHHLYLADSANHGVDVVDTSSATPHFVGTIDVAGLPNGLAFAPDLHRLYAGLIGGYLAVIDTDSMQVVKRLQVDTLAADLLDYSPQRQRVYIGTGQSGDVVAVDASTNEVKERLPAKVPVEQPRYDPADGMLYASSTETDSVLKFNPATGTLTKTYKLAGCHVAGLAINPSRQLALATCGATVAFINLGSGAYDISRLVAGGDLVTYDAAADRFLVASSHSKNDSTVGVFYGDGRYLGSVAATPRAHQAVFDDAHGVVYAVSATGLMSFKPRECEPPPEWLAFAGRGSVFVAPMLVFALFLIWYARRPRGPAGPKWDDLKKEDLAAERERMRELEDSIYGPQVE